MRIYLDAAPVVYVVEQIHPHSDALDRHLSRNDVTLIASDMTRLECRVKPLRDRNVSLLADYDQFFQRVVHETVTLSSDLVDLATEIRATHGFRTPDAIHLAAASIAKCDLFLTNDHHLRQYRGLEVETVS